MFVKSHPFTILRFTMGLLIGILSFISIANAQTPYERNNSGTARDAVSYVTVYEDCNFRGKSRALAVGTYNNVRSLNIRNDSISSIEIPDGLQIVLYEHENKRGASTILSSTVSCLNRQWNDKASSLEVRDDGRNAARSGSRRDNGYQQRPAIDNRNYTANISHIEFSGAALSMQGRGLWNIVNESGHVSTFQEQSRDNQVIFLRSNETNQMVHANIRDKVITFFSRNGQQIDYTIDRANSSRSGARDRNSSPKTKSSPAWGLVNGRCFKYKAWTRGGSGGVKFYDNVGLKRIGNDVHRGEICHDGTLKAELLKQDLNTEVILEVEGQTFKFSPKEEPEVFLNTWYRKGVVLKKRR